MTNTSADTKQRLSPSRSLIALVGLLLAGGLLAQSVEPNAVTSSVDDSALTREQLTDARKSLIDANDLSDQARKTAADLYDKAAAHLAAAHATADETKTYALDEKEAAGRIARWQEAATRLATTQPIEIPDDADLAQLQTSLQQHKAQLETLEKQAKAIEDRIANRPDRLKELPALIAQLETTLAGLSPAEAPPADPNIPEAVSKARLVARKAQRQATAAQLEARKKELATFETRGKLMRAESSWLSRRIAETQRRVDAWQQAVTEKQQAESLETVREAEKVAREAAEKHPVLSKVAEENTELAARSVGPDAPLQKLSDARSRLDRVQKQLNDLTTTFETLKEMVDKVGATNEIGQLLRNQLALLPDTARIRSEIDTLQEEISQVQLRLISLNDRRSRLADIDAYAEQILAEAGNVPESAPRREQLLAELRRLLEARKTLVQKLINEYEQYYSPLLTLTEQKRVLVERTEALRAFINERVLWIPSTDPVGLSDLAELVGAVRQVVAPSLWVSLCEALRRDATGNPVVVGLGVLVVGGLIVGRRKLSGIARRLDAEVKKDYPGAMWMTLWSLVLVVLLAATGPAIIALLGWRLSAGGRPGSAADAAGVGLWFVAICWFPLALLRGISRSRGLGEVHFRWSVDALKRVRLSLVTPLLIGLPLLFVVAASQVDGQAAERGGVGRLAAIVALVGLGAYLAILLRPGGKVHEGLAVRRKDSWVASLWRLWYLLAVAVPVSLGVIAAMGYYYTTLQLSARLVEQIWWILGLILLNGVLIRSVFIGRRRLTMREIETRRAVQEEKRKRQAEGEEQSDLVAEVEPEHVDLAAVNEQTRSLVRWIMLTLFVVGTWMIWDDVLPALGILREVTLWSAGGASVTLAHVIAAIVTIALTVAAARNVAGILEITVLQRFHAEAGLRYAVNALARYAIIVIGVVMAFNAIGVGWSQVQWLVAAMTVGLGFGLQEIFANFVCGLIILFERPIRVGDIVTVGGVTGAVSRIRIRATTITDWDRRELILPNKDFITGQLINWTLSDSVIRVVIPVGIAYGSNTRLARDLMLQVAAKAERVLDEPPPQAFFMEFGDSTLNYELRVHVDGLQDFLRVRNDLLSMVDDIFREHNIEIAFPQRDIHVRMGDGQIPVSLRQDQPDQPGSSDKPVADPPEDVG
jgi:potassium-dependent mechanosensitive channel